MSRASGDADRRLIEIAAHLPPAPDALLALGGVSRRLHGIAQAPVLWVRLFGAAGYALDPEVVPRLVAARSAPGRWAGRRWLPALPGAPGAQEQGPDGWSLWPSAWLGRLGRLKRAPTPAPASQPPAPAPTEDQTRAQIPVHWPTLFRARQLAGAEAAARGPHPLYDPARDAANPFHPSHFAQRRAGAEAGDSDGGGGGGGDGDAFGDSDAAVVYPRQLWQMRDHGAKIYACAVRGRWLVTGARDRCVNVYRLPRLPNDGAAPAAGPELVLREKVHGSSVLHLDFCVDAGARAGASLSDEGDEGDAAGARPRGARGLLVTSATETVHTWDIAWPASPEAPEAAGGGAPRLTKRATLLGSEAPVSDVRLHGPWVCVMYVNGLCRVYDAGARGDAIPLRTVFGGESCHLMALRAGRVLLAGDERTVEFDLHSGREMGRSRRSTAGRVTSMDWDVSTLRR